jgi:DNA-binding MarR family transcriptional regulator
MTLEEELKNSTPIPPQTRAILNILFTASWLDCLMNRTLRDYGLTNPQYNILRILRGSPQGLSVLDIKSRMIDRSSNVSRLVEKLREQELVERIISNEDRRMVVVSISKKGLEMIDAIGDQMNQGDDKAIGNKMTEQELLDLSLLIDKLRL